MKVKNSLNIIVLLVLCCLMMFRVNAQKAKQTRNVYKAIIQSAFQHTINNRNKFIDPSLPRIPVPSVSKPMFSKPVLLKNSKDSVKSENGKEFHKLRIGLKKRQSKVLTVIYKKGKETNAVLAMANRFINYAKINSQSVDTTDFNVFPITSGQKQMAEYLENELRFICQGKNVLITRSKDQYVYVKIPSNIANKKVPSLMLMAHLDVTPEIIGGNVKPIIHEKYDGGEIKLPSGIVINPESPQGKHLKNCIGKTIITSDGSTLLGADDKAGVTILVGLLEEIVNNKKMKHGDIYLVFSQNEDVGRAADRFEAEYVGGNPDIVIDVDGCMADRFSVENFTASMFIYHFKGHEAHPGDGFVNKYGDALTSASYFIGNIPPVRHPSASKDKQGYIHCYSMVHPTDSTGKEISEDYLVKVRLRYFDKNEGDTLRQILKNAKEVAAKAFPNVSIEDGQEIVQYENIAYTMYPGVVELIVKSAKNNGMTLIPCSERGGTTSAMMAAKGLRGGPCIYSGQQAAHSLYEWVCVEDMVKMVDVITDVVKNVSAMRK